MGPYEKNCPLKYLDLALPTKPNSYSEEWRNNVRAFWTAKKDARDAAAKLNRGDEFKSEMSGKTFIFIRIKSPTFVLAEDETGKLYRVRKTDICWPVFRPQESAAI
jgi:hypothetical protein